jgi:rod shape-determining protein MreC
VALPRRTGRSRLTLALLILTSIAVLTLDFRGSGIVRGARGAVATVLSPLQGVGRTATSPFRNGWNGMTHYGDVKSENDRLRARIAELEGTATEGQVAAQEYEDLLKETQIQWIGEIPHVAARVVAGPTSNFSHSIEIDKGSKAGIKAGMPVVSGAGLVGRVQQVTSSHAVIQLLTDPDFRVGVKHLPDGVLGTARGAGEGDPLVVDTGIDAETKLELGGEVTTSGADRSAFPAAIPVGTVRGTEKAGGGLTLDLDVEPAVDTQRLSFVTVLIWVGTG